jgi:hypothetical protein
MFLTKEFHNHGADRQYCKLSVLLCSKNVTHTTQQISLSLFFLKSTKILENNKNNKKIVLLEKSYQKEETVSNTTKKKGLRNSPHVTYGTGEPANGNSVELFMKSQQLFSYLRNCLPVGSTLTQQANLLHS